MYIPIVLLYLVHSSCAVDDNPDIYLTADCTTCEQDQAFSQYCQTQPKIQWTNPEIISRYGYPSETHTVQTSDGYLLSMHRIPHGRGGADTGKRPPVFLQHGLLSSSVDWLFTGPDHSLAFGLADRGYDVWLGNIRGNDYSRSHATLRPNQPAFWRFSWDEMAERDVPEMIDHVLAVTGRSSVSYIGHSMGTTMYFAMMSQLPAYHSKVNLMIALAPAVFMTHMRSPIRKLLPWIHDIEVMEKWLGATGELLPQDKVLRYLAEEMCAATDASLEVCSNFMFVISGYDKPQLNESLVPVILSHTPSGASTMTPIHYAQLIQSGRFCKYDYEDDNEKVYNSTTPPSYNLRNVLTPVILYSGDNDLLVNAVDLALLKATLPRLLDHYVVPLPSFNHIDFLFAKDAPTLVYERVFKQLLQYAPPPATISDNVIDHKDSTHPYYTYFISNQL